MKKPLVRAYALSASVGIQLLAALRSADGRGVSILTACAAACLAYSAWRDLHRERRKQQADNGPV